MTGIKMASYEDVPLIGALAHSIWPRVYDYMISKEQIKYMLQLIYSQESLTEQIEDGQSFVIYYENGVAMGFAGFAIEEGEDVFKLHKLYLDPDLQRKGIGLLLLNYVIDQAKNAGTKTLRLNVNKYNKTLSFYEKYGFEITEEVVVDIGGGFVMDDYLMEKGL